jgi:hypothetical protein
VISAQYGLNSNSNVEDVAATVRYFGRVSSPIVLVGHGCSGPFHGDFAGPVGGKVAAG